MNPLKWFWQGLTTPSSRAADSTPLPFSLRAEQVLALSRKEAERMNHNFVGN
jgi:hypothetical protein